MYLHHLIAAGPPTKRANRSQDCPETIPGALPTAGVEDLKMKGLATNGAYMHAEHFQDLTHEEAFKLLQKQDPERACQIHPRDHRRVLKALNSNLHPVVRECRQFDSGVQSKAHNHAKYVFCILLLDCDDDEELRQKFKDRIDEMVKSGLMNECLLLRVNGSQAVSTCLAPSGTAEPHSLAYGTGILQAIAYKEFRPLLDAITDHEAKALAEDPNTIASCAAALLANTWRLCRKQRRWIRHKWIERRELDSGPGDIVANQTAGLFDNSSPRVVPLFQINTASVDRGAARPSWKEGVLEPAFRILQGFVTWSRSQAARDGKLFEHYLKELPGQATKWNVMDFFLRYDSSTLENGTQVPRLPAHQPLFCEKCNLTCYGNHEWQAHLQSRNHRKRRRRPVEISYA
eukprot:GHVT01069046.1.p1 GENE.GHVT01069046.1~~GHVT01069046.1.p1  ORF type:complete len:402 (+),score=18.78 GHVT01069046.1:739-1944(+)